MRYYPAGKKYKIDSIWAGPYLIVATPRLDGGHSATPGRANDIHPLSGCEKDTPTQWAAVVDYDSSAGRYSGGSNVRC